MTERKRNKFSRHDSVQDMGKKINASLSKKSCFTGHGMTDTEAGYLLFSLEIIEALKKLDAR